MYIESKAWVTNLKQKLACGSILVSNKMEYYEFFTRALKPGVHYVEVDANNLCLDTADKVRPTADLATQGLDSHASDAGAEVQSLQIRAMNDAFDRAGLLPSPAEAKLATTPQGRRHLRAGNYSSPAARSAVIQAGRALEASRRTLRQGPAPSNFTTAPWNVGLASQQVGCRP